jgi:hypothetical protein
MSRQPSSTISSRNASTLQKLLISGASVNGNTTNPNTPNHHLNGHTVNSTRSYVQMPSYERSIGLPVGNQNLEKDSQRVSSSRRGTKLVYPSSASTPHNMNGSFEVVNGNSRENHEQKHSNFYTELNSDLIKKQEKEIKSQLSPSFWARLNEATKPMAYSFDYNNSTFQAANLNHKQPRPFVNFNPNQTMVPALSFNNNINSNNNNNDTVNVNGNNDKSSTPSYALKISLPTSASNGVGHEIAYANIIQQNGNYQENNDSSKNSNTRPSPRVQIYSNFPQNFQGVVPGQPQQQQQQQMNQELAYQQFQQYQNQSKQQQSYQTRSNDQQANITLMEQLPIITRRMIHGNKSANSEENISNGVKSQNSSRANPNPNSYHLDRHNSFSHGPASSDSKLRATLSNLNLNAQVQSQVAAQIQNRQDVESINSVPSLVYLSNNGNNNKNNIDSSSSLNQKVSNDASSNKISNSTPVNMRPESSPFYRSKSMVPTDRTRLKSYLISNFQNDGGNSNNSGGGGGSSSGSQNYKLMPKSLVIRSRVQNYYKDFLDDMNTYSSNLTDNFYKNSKSHNDLSANGGKYLKDTKKFLINYINSNAMNNTVIGNSISEETQNKSLNLSDNESFSEDGSTRENGNGKIIDIKQANLSLTSDFLSNKEEFQNSMNGNISLANDESNEASNFSSNKNDNGVILETPNGIFHVHT